MGELEKTQRVHTEPELRIEKLLFKNWFRFKTIQIPETPSPIQSVPFHESPPTPTMGSPPSTTATEAEDATIVASAVANFCVQRYIRTSKKRGNGLLDLRR